MCASGCVLVWCECECLCVRVGVSERERDLTRSASASIVKFVVAVIVRSRNSKLMQINLVKDKYLMTGTEET